MPRLFERGEEAYIKTNILGGLSALRRITLTPTENWPVSVAAKQDFEIWLALRRKVWRLEETQKELNRMLSRRNERLGRPGLQ